MRILLFLSLISLVFSGCTSIGSTHPEQVAPTPEDWQAAFARLDRKDQAIIRGEPFSLRAVEPIPKGLIYCMYGGDLSRDLFVSEELNIPAICEGFNRAFGRGSGIQWTVVVARTYEQIGTPDGIETDRFELDWTLRNQSGRTARLSAMDAGPGVKIIWGASRDALDAEMNQAFAVTFLELAAQLARLQSRG